MTTIDDKIARLRSMTAQITEVGLISYPDGHSGLSAVAAQEFAELIDELDKAGILGPQPGQPEPLMRYTVASQDNEDSPAIDVWVVNNHRETVFFTSMVADAGHFIDDGGTAARLPDYVLNPTPAIKEN